MNRRWTAAVAALLFTSGLVGAPVATLPASAQSTIVVDTTASGVNPSDGRCSFVEAMWAAEVDASEAVTASPPEVVVNTECTAGSGADTIVLPHRAVINLDTVVNDLNNAFGPTATPLVRSTIVIEGNGTRIQRTGTDLMRAFAVDGAGQGDLTLRDLHLKDFLVRGGDGTDGGGGGLGAGGAVYVRGGELTVERTTFEANRAEGGNGGNSGQGAGGGGGGMGGDGGGGYGRVEQFNSSGGGGGGGARGDGGDSETVGPYGQLRGGTNGGGGGGTITSGESDDGSAYTGNPQIFDGGAACGGHGGEHWGDGQDGCDGGGGGGGGEPDPDPLGYDGGTAGKGGYGGGGGGGGFAMDSTQFDWDVSASSGGHGGFGGGGGSGGVGRYGGPGGFGAGGGGGTLDGGEPGTFGGSGGHDAGDYNFQVTGAGGGGAGLGGAIFSDLGKVTVRNSTFTANSVMRGVAGTGQAGAKNGSDGGAAIFGVDGTISISASTISGNESTGKRAGVVMYHSTRTVPVPSITLENTIVAGNIPGVAECELIGSINAAGSGNLFTNNVNCLGQAVTGDPLLGVLTTEAPGETPTMAIDASSAAFDAGDDAVCESFDQRGVSRPRSQHCDIGAYEFVPPSADLTVATTSLGRAVAGEDVAYLVDVRNNGPTAAENVTVTDKLPTGSIFVSAVASGGFACTGSGPVTCTNPLMSEGASALFTITVHLPSTVASGTSVTNAVVVGSATTPDPVPANNQDAVANTVITRADVSVTKTGPSSPVAGTDVSYVLAVENDGPSVARTVALSDVLPSGTTFRSITSPAGWTCTAPAVGQTGSIGCSVQSLASGAAASFALVVRLDPSTVDGGDLCNSASVTAATTDPEVANNSSASCGSVRRLADLAVSQTVMTSGRAGKGSATFTVTVTNHGPSDSSQVKLRATSELFNGPPPTAMTTGGATCSVVGSTVWCDWSSIAVGATAQVVVTVQWRSSVGSVCVTNLLTAGTSDADSTNNSGGVCASKRR